MSSQSSIINDNINSSSVIHIESKEHFEDVIKTNKHANPLFVLDFTATWCGPCKKMSPIFDKLSSDYSSNNAAIFMKIDIDQNQALSNIFEVTSIPQFTFIRNGIVLETFKGANADKLKSTVQKYVTTSD